MANLTEPDNIRLQEESDVHAILGRPPAWLTRWGITFVFVSMVFLHRNSQYCTVICLRVTFIKCHWLNFISVLFAQTAQMRTI